MKKLLIGLIPLLGLSYGAQDLVHRGGKDELAFTQLEVGSNSPITTPGVTVIRSEKQFHDYVAKIGELDIKRRPIDWSTYQVIAVNMEGLADEGFGVAVKRLHLTSAGHYDIEFTIGASQGVPSLLPLNPNMVKRNEYPFALIETRQVDAVWKVAVEEESSDSDGSR